MEIGAVTEILKDVIARRIARQTDPVRAFATHMCVAGGTALHRQHQAVTADAGECAAALGNVGRAVVRTAGTEMRWAFGQARQAAQRGALVHPARNPPRQLRIASACEDAFPPPAPRGAE